MEEERSSLIPGCIILSNGCSSSAHTHYQLIEKIMKFTINCTRVPIPQGTTLYGTPVDVGPARAFPGGASNDAAPPRASNDGNTLNLSRRILPNRAEPTPCSSKPKTLLVVKTKLFLALLMLGPLPPKGA